ncbi:hypothetical protein KGE51_04730 [Lactobacillus amylovorus]|nr:hypothetical protein [Lactobacillus amylovorus]UIK35869.1 hypothetical protein KGE51_04730 [Lactobacillus amylovorus]
MTVSELIFNGQKFYSQSSIISYYVDKSPIGKTLTLSEYKIGWLADIDTSQKFNDTDVQWSTPSDAIGLLPLTGNAAKIIISQQGTAYYLLEHFIQTGGSNGHTYRNVIKVSDIMTFDSTGDL